MGVRLGSVSRRTLREQVLAQLRTAIVSGQLEPGARLAEVDLAEQLGVSRGTVREALRTLEQSGLVAEADRGLAVRVPTTREIQEIFAVRASLEGMAVATIMMMDPSERHGRIAQLQAALPPAADETIPYSERVTRDLAFHELLCALAENAILLETWRLLQDRMLVVILSDPEQRPHPIMSMDHHAPIVEAMRSGGVVQAQEAVRSHMSDAARLYEERQPA